MRRAARARIEAVGVEIDVDQPVGELSVGRRQIVAIAKALTYASRILVMDEPTAALTRGGSRATVHGDARDRRARRRHRLYLAPARGSAARRRPRDGAARRPASPEAPASAPQSELVRLLVGRPLTSSIPPRATFGRAGAAPGAGGLSAPNADAPAGRRRVDVSLEVRAGEIVGLAGIMGAGRTELLSALYGAAGRRRLVGYRRDRRRAGAPLLDSRRRGAGLGFVTDDRRGSGLMLRDSVGRNIVMSILRGISPFFLMSRGARGRARARAIRAFDVRPPLPEVPVGALSGGNQQKVVLAKEVLGDPRLLLLDEPTRGVDVGAKGEIYARIRALAGRASAC